MSEVKKIRMVLKGRPTVKRPGIHLKRALGYYQVPQFDPFLLPDDIHSDYPSEYLPGFPWHPHRGIETITYALRGGVEHGDGMGNKGVISSGDMQQMTAGNGIIHQHSYPRSQKGRTACEKAGDQRGICDGKEGRSGCVEGEEEGLWR